MLEKEGFVAEKVEINTRGQNRKVYSISKEGTLKLQQWLKEPANPETFKFEVLLKVCFGDQVSKNQIIKHIEEFKARNRVRLENILSIEKEMKNHLNENERAFFGLLTILLGKNLHLAADEWADSAIRKIKEHIPK